VSLAEEQNKMPGSFDESCAFRIDEVVGRALELRYIPPLEAKILRDIAESYRAREKVRPDTKRRVGVVWGLRIGTTVAAFIAGIFYNLPVSVVIPLVFLVLIVVSFATKLVSSEHIQ
jgi:hypothetical protein